jgi:hypothetical protein
MKIGESKARQRLPDPRNYVSTHRAALSIESSKFLPGIHACNEEQLQHSPNQHVVRDDMIPMTCRCISIALSKPSQSVFQGVLRSIQLIVYGFCNPIGSSVFWHSWPAWELGHTARFIVNVRYEYMGSLCALHVDSFSHSITTFPLSLALSPFRAVDQILELHLWSLQAFIQHGACTLQLFPPSTTTRR